MTATRVSAPALTAAPEPPWPALAVMGGLLLLLVRPWERGLGGSAALLAVYAALGALALTASSSPAGTAAPASGEVGSQGPPLGWTFPLLLGLAAVSGAALLAGPAPRAAFAASGLALNAVAAVAEEAFFRRLLYGRLLRFGVVAAVAGSAVAFGLIHVPLYGWTVLPVDVAAGLLLSWQRWASGSWGTSAVTHVAANILVVLR